MKWQTSSYNIEATPTVLALGSWKPMADELMVLRNESLIALLCLNSDAEPCVVLRPGLRMTPGVAIAADAMLQELARDSPEAAPEST
jgi:hypothetical protein